MKVLVNVFHPNLNESKVNKKWVERLQRENVTINNLYEKYPNWEFDLECEQKLLLEHDRIVFQFPFYWYSTPPLLKKWQDDILTFGWAYGTGGDKLKGKEFVLAISVGGSQKSYQAGGYNNYTISELTRPLQQTANLTGMEFLSSFVLYKSVVASEQEIEKSAEDLVKHVLNPELNPAAGLKRILSEMAEKDVTL
ncbi:NAD(P)H-dependent oxidoreductase [Priestia megaterium]|uniref:NAD(P)H-dependent oxidoreductase n=1 Tax=Priestia megaterium TaxID=1404 RepID=UPI002861E5D8|nr:NAD(P)H-dependent oxidoreductase [Priestia megaterium]MDR7246733.1 putative NADPH-quinone reductase [Priestia megaterium]